MPLKVGDRESVIDEDVVIPLVGAFGIAGCDGLYAKSLTVGYAASGAVDDIPNQHRLLSLTAIGHTIISEQ